MKHDHKGHNRQHDMPDQASMVKLFKDMVPCNFGT